MEITTIFYLYDDINDITSLVDYVSCFVLGYFSYYTAIYFGIAEMVC